MKIRQRNFKRRQNNDEKLNDFLDKVIQSKSKNPPQIFRRWSWSKTLVGMLQKQILFLAFFALFHFSYCQEYIQVGQRNIDNDVTCSVWNSKAADRRKQQGPPVALTENEKIENFLCWFRAKGGWISPNVTIKSYPEYGGYGLYAKDDIAYYDNMYQIPADIILSVESIREGYSTFNAGISERLEKVQSHGGDDAVIALQLMVECALGAESDIQPYLDIMPDGVPRLDTFSDSDLAMLQDPSLASLSHSARQRMQRTWTDNDLEGLLFTMLLRSNLPQSFQPNPSCLSYESFHKFNSVVGSRAMVLNGKKYLTPLPDMANYAPRYDGRKFGEQSFSFNLYHQRNSRGDIHVMADRMTLKGEQVFEDYGDVDNTLYLEAFGFIPHENPFNCAVLNTEMAYSDKTMYLLRRLQLIQKSEDGGLSFPEPCVLRDGTLAHSSFRPFFSVIGLSDDEAMQQTCNSAIESGDDEFIISSCFRYDGHQERELAAISELAKFTLAGKATSLDEDFKLFSAQDNDSIGSYQSQTALRFRVNEKIILDRLAQDDFAVTEIASDVHKVDSTTCASDTSSNSLHESVNEFNLFANSLGFPVHHMEARIIGNGLRVGAVATKDLNIGEIYHSVPNESVICSNTIMSNIQNDELKMFLQSVLSSGDEFHVLLLYILYERFLMKEKSNWWPYLQILPEIREFQSNSPLWFDEDRLDLLAGSDARNEIVNYQRHVSRKFSQMIQSNEVLRVFGAVFTKDNYYWAHSIIDSRAIWWDNTRHLVPLLDLVNCSKEPTIIHRTDVGSDGKSAETRATLTYKKGDQIYENYGQPNYIYFMYHGFILDQNPHDCVLFSNLRINQDDETAKDMDQTHQRLSAAGFRSYNPSFCIRDSDESLGSMAQFLRIKHGRPDEENTSDLIAQTLADRLSRIHAVGRTKQPDVNLQYAEECMLQMVNAEQSIILSILNQLQ
uniref:SET domain-containing protein n=1 Tax=Leptocylindrus danicus TaxID=163516 RepID=A0A7S2L968_9STRA|eukprot:CAMPEP_0116008232 /NCGR_PEP_ID=MMETSP0321-20121206/2749_1 /TAXON_ID=163516 /ORGANISM="Leptocylindrus danicus var. danicus, Strain B650" /LENGTH=951 /DNA_ID=CAMNT_0003477033 /DNA_START=29 /DNA_END=2884 /DNA_ORIENTATION=-